jgi:tRNA threonylcarbamoyladenosine modification (KEOPS) complex  Pcc1 subunit
MKVQFEDKSYIEIKKSNEPDKIIILIQAKDASSPLKKIINSVEITAEQWQQLITDIT